jgi:tetratricopeptide (TPR) repeat protein
MTGKYLFAAALAVLSARAGGAVTVIGNSSARLCYEAAEARISPARDSIATCDAALYGEGLSRDDRVATLVNRGILRMRGGAFDPAIADFDAAIADDPKQAEAYLDKGMALVRAGRDWESAVALFNTALEKRTRKPALAYYGRAVAQESRGRIKDAYLDYREASRLDPKWRDPQVELSRFSVRSQ